jgi:hypothetical protein
MLLVDSLIGGFNGSARTTTEGMSSINSSGSREVLLAYAGGSFNSTRACRRLYMCSCLYK